MPKRGGSKSGIKSSKKLVVDNTITIIIEQDKLPKGAKLHGYENFYHQELIIKKQITCFRRARYTLLDGRSVLAPLPPEIQDSFGNNLKNFIVQQYHVCNVPENKIRDQLDDIGIDISEGKIHNILMKSAEKLQAEAENIFKEGLKSKQLRTDDTYARYEKQNWFTTVIQNEFFAYFKTTASKSRKNFLHILQQFKIQYALNESAYCYMRTMKTKSDIIENLLKYENKTFKSLDAWEEFLNSVGINKRNTGKKTLQCLEEAALLGGVANSGVNLDAVLTSDNAPQFKKIFLLHALCWIHMIRSISKIVPVGEAEIIETERVLDQIWKFYQKLKDYQDNPSAEQITELDNEFDTIFGQTIKSQELLEGLCSFKKYKDGLLCVLKHSETPLHNNSSESDIRPAVIKRKISGPTRSPQGRDARDTGLTIVKTCRKLKISPWTYIADRLNHKSTLLPLAELIHQRVIAERSPP